MKTGYTKIIFVIDRSGSMSNIAKDMEGGFKSFIEQQKKENFGQCDVSLYQFDDKYDAVFENVNLSDVPSYSLIPRGGTAMNDAICKTINTVGETLSKMNESDRPDRVLFVIITDGQENSSKEYSGQQVKDLIKRQTEQYSWTFTYLGANQDAWFVAQSFGIADTSKVLKYAANVSGVACSWNSLARNVSAYRGSSIGGAAANACFAYSEKDKQEQVKSGA